MVGGAFAFAVVLGAFVPLQPLPARTGPRATLCCCASADGPSEPDLSAWRNIRHRLARSWEGEAAGGDEGWAHTLPSPEPGCLLLAKPNVRFVNDPAKMLSVVLLLSHSESDGTVGLALNRPTDHKLSKVLDGGRLLEAFGDRPIHLGGTSLESNGTSSAGRLYMLTSRRPPATDELAQEVLPGSTYYGSTRLTVAVLDLLWLYCTYYAQLYLRQVLPGLYLASGAHAARAVVRGEAAAEEYEFYAGFFSWAPVLTRARPRARPRPRPRALLPRPPQPAADLGPQECRGQGEAGESRDER